MNLKFRVYSISSECSEFPASNIQNENGQWESDRNCSYPQEMTVQFYVPIQTKQMRIMFHQYKIPKFVEVFIKCSKHEKYRKLGMIQPNDNAQSNYLQKEIKTVFFEFPCTFVKLVFHENYQNEMNLFGQVALCELVFEGEFLPAREYKTREANVLDWIETSSDDESSLILDKEKNEVSVVQEKKSIASTFTSNLYPDVFKKLEEAKREAVDKEEFQKAEYIKKSINSFQSLEKEIMKLEEQKKVSLSEEDYDKCHKLKEEINRKKELLTYQLKEFQDQIFDNNSLAFSRATQNPTNRSNYTSREQRLETEETAQRSPVMNAPSMPFQEYESQVVPALRKKKQEESYLTNQRANDSILDSLRSPNTEKKEDFDYVEESVEIRTFDANRMLLECPELEHLDFKNHKKYEPFFDYIRLDIWRMILSDKYQKNWKLKSAALDEVLSYEISEGKHLIAIMEFVALTLCDNHTANIKRSLKLLYKLISLPDKDIWCDPNYPRFCVNVILDALIHIMNDTKEEFKKMSVEIYQNLPEFVLVLLETAVKALIKSSQVGKNKRKNNPRQTQAKLMVMEYYLSTYTDIVHHLNDIIKWLAECANDPNSEIKMTAIQLLIEIARMDKEFLHQVKNELKKQSLDSFTFFEAQYNALIAEIDSSKLITERQILSNDESIDVDKRMTNKNKKGSSSKILSQHDSESLFTSPRRLKESEEIELAYSQESIDQSRSHSWFENQKNSERNEEEIRVMEPEDEEMEGRCDYCYRKIEDMNLQDHLLEHCSVVIPCIHCGNVVYLREMTNHWLEGCDKKKHQQCPRCLLAFEFDEINEHVARKICRKAKENMERCPFCEEDIEPEDLDWVEHSERCTKIIRPPTSSESLAYYSESERSKID